MTVGHCADISREVQSCKDLPHEDVPCEDLPLDELLGEDVPCEDVWPNFLRSLRPSLGPRSLRRRGLVALLLYLFARPGVLCGQIASRAPSAAACSSPLSDRRCSISASRSAAPASFASSSLTVAASRAAFYSSTSVPGATLSRLAPSTPPAAARSPPYARLTAPQRSGRQAWRP